MLNCGIIWSHLVIGKVGSQLERPEMKWFLQVLISLIVVLQQCLCIFMNFKSMLCFWKVFLRSSENSLQGMWSFGVYTLCFSLLKIFFQQFCMDLSSWFWMAFYMAAFELQSLRTRTQLFPMNYWTRNFMVCSDYDCINYFLLMKITCCFYVQGI